MHDPIAFLVPADPGSPGKRAVKWVCVCVCMIPCFYKHTLANATYKF